MNKKGTIGEILTKFPSIIFLLLVIIAYILVSTFIIRDNIQSYSLADDLLDDYVVYENKIITVEQVLSGFCNMNVFSQDEFITKTNLILNEHFESKYGAGSYFAFTRGSFPKTIYFSNLNLIEFDIDEEGDLAILSDNGKAKFDSLFDPNLKNVEIRNSKNIAPLCSLDYFLHVKEGV